VNYGELIGEAFSIAWRNRFLWFFGLFVGTSVGSPGVPSNSGGTFPVEEENRSMPSLGTFVEPARQWAVENLLAISLAALLVFVIFIPLGIVGQLAVRDAVVGGGRVFASIGNGFRLFRRNLGKGVLLWFIQLVVGVIASILFAITLLIVGALLGVPSVLLLVFAGKSVGIGALVFSGVVFMLLSVVLLAAISTFNHAYWTLAYLRLVALSTGPLPTAGQDGQTND
jgi:hypothetical protein